MKHIAYWTQESDPDESLSIIKTLALSHAYEGGDTGERIANCIVSGDFLSVCNWDLDYATESVGHALNCRQALAFFQKSTFVDLKVDKEKVAKIKFLEAEKACSETNELFRQRAAGKFSFLPGVESILFRAQQKIARVLGEPPSFEEIKYRFGPGATTLTKKREASISEKFGTGISCSEALLPYAARLLEEMPHYCSVHEGPVYSRLSDKEECTRVPVVVHHGIVEFVPKNAKTHRSIVKEPSLNTMIQLGLGDIMSKRLRAFGIDLKDQSINQRLALEGSLSGGLATLDLSSASDTISTELVFDLLPVGWALLLDLARSATVLLDGSPLRLEKFSSMGNGFTFPLESLIFWALSSSASNDNFASVYGDDIVVTTESVPAVMHILETCGFSINKEKSFWSGPFRESCGADYLKGIDIRPYYQKKLISPAELFRLHNFYWRRHDLERAEAVKQLIHPDLVIYGPDNYGDGHLLGDWKRRSHKRAASHGYGGALFDTYSLVPNKDRRALRPGDRVLPVYTVYVRENGDSILPPIDFATPRLAGLYGLDRGGWSYASEPMSERTSPVDNCVYKTPSLPGTSGYKRVSIYTFD